MTQALDVERLPARVSRGELERRWRAARAQMLDQGIDALVMQNANDWLGGPVKYFTNVPACNGYPRTVIFPLEGAMTIVENGPFDGRRRLDGDDATHPGVGEILHSPSFLSIGYTHGYDAAIIGRELARQGLRKVGIVGAGGLPHGFVARVRDDLAARGGEARDASELVDRLKAIKSEEERALIRQTAALQDSVFSAVLANIRPGMRDVDVTALAWREGQVLGSEQGIVLGGSAPLGRASVFVGRHLQGRRLAAGDHLALLIEINGPGGFYTEMARTIVLGRAPTELRDGFESMREAQQATLRRLVPGASCAEIATAHDDFMRARKLPPELRLYAHGQGYDMVERPLVRCDEAMKIQSGMCLAVHPGFESPSQFAVICDNYLVEDGGVGACLHKTEKRVFEVG